MFGVLDRSSRISDPLWSWRLSLRLIPAICLFWVSHDVDSTTLLWLLRVAVVSGGLHAGLRWESRA